MKILKSEITDILPHPRRLSLRFLSVLSGFAGGRLAQDVPDSPQPRRNPREGISRMSEKLEGFLNLNTQPNFPELEIMFNFS
ncbi:hypothetical protein [Hydrogenimonas sp. SS33]|uniref:hypothetical protein n=1 Tax=Hydrogenimonas leucolamina TaxID=2954236 RepID=UPI00336BE2AC